MTPVERLQAAIDKLTRLRAEGSAGGDSWERSGARIVFKDNGQKFGIVDVENWGAPADLDMIVTLHDTIDAQLNLLRGNAAWISAYGDHSLPEVAQQIVALADAILGGDS